MYYSTKRRTAEPEFGGARYLLSQSRTSGRARVLHAGPLSSYLGASNHGCDCSAATGGLRSGSIAAPDHAAGRRNSLSLWDKRQPTRPRRWAMQTVGGWCLLLLVRVRLAAENCSRICKTQKPVIKSILKNVNMWSGLLCIVYTGASIFPSPGPRHIEGGKTLILFLFVHFCKNESVVL